MPSPVPLAQAALAAGALLLGTAAVSGLSPATSSAAQFGSPTITIDPDRELFVTDVRVVDHPGYVSPGRDWHFGTMMDRISGSLPADQFVTDWIDTWLTPQPVNGVDVFDANHATSISKIAYGNATGTNPGWAGLGLTSDGFLDPAKAPFRLLAIVNRPDLVRVENGQVRSAGEMRFIYCSYNAGDVNTAQNFTVIFEFEVPADSCEDVVAWHQRWHELGDYPIGSPKYLEKLSAMTRDVVLPDPTSGLPNDSNIGQVRTNNFVAVPTWELREFDIDPATGALANVTTKQTPHQSFLDTQSGNPTGPSRARLAEYLTANQGSIDGGTHVVPDFFTPPSTGVQLSFQTGQAVNQAVNVLNVQGTIWFAPGFSANASTNNKDTRHRFALQTCSGCHQQETGTNFQMVEPRLPGQESFVADFITGAGTTVPDPIDSQIPRGPFHDLATREALLIRILELDCGSGVPSPEVELADIAATIGTRVH